MSSPDKRKIKSKLQVALLSLLLVCGILAASMSSATAQTETANPQDTSRSYSDQAKSDKGVVVTENGDVREGRRAAQSRESITASENSNEPETDTIYSQKKPRRFLKALEFLDDPELARKHPIGALLLRQHQGLTQHEQAPGVAFRRWASSPKPVLPTLLFLLFAGIVSNAFFPARLAMAQECCKRHFWGCLGRALVVGIIVGIAIRILLALGITIPLALLFSGLIQFGILGGLCVGITLIGDRILSKTGLLEKSWLIDHPRWTIFFKIVAGSLLLTAIAQIPGVGRLPQIGIRLVMLVAILGAGGLLKTKFGTEPIE